MNSQPRLQTIPQQNQNPQIMLFAPALLPRKLPILKSGPEDEPKSPVKH